MEELCSIRLERLLLSTDGSEFSEGAIREAVRLAKNCKCELSALYVIEFNPEFEALAPKLVEKMEVGSKQHLASVRERALKEGVDCKTLIRRTEAPYQAIVEEAGKLKADVIVMGRRGRSGLKKLMMGSVTAKVIGHSACDVLVVPRQASILCKNILVATDGSLFSNQAVSEAVGIAKRCGARLYVVSAVHAGEVSPFDITQFEMQKGLIASVEIDRAEKDIAQAKELAQKEGVSVEGIIAGGRPYEVIVETAHGKNADLIVMGSHGRTGVEKFLMGSVTERVIGHAGCAVLVVKLKRA
ncbi:MAG: universal stress protein [Nitrospirae bacterium]|nr:universal stress protein [Nitrospirota bacterium]